MALLRFFVDHGAEAARLASQHLLLVLIATGTATLIGAPVGVGLTRRPSLAKPVLAVANVLQTIPSLALFGFLIPLLGRYGIGRLPAVIALVLYSLLPIIRNTYTGIIGVDAGVREAARGMGMKSGQMLLQVELPLALPVILAGVRVATVISVGTATIAAAIGAGGLGTWIFRGLRMNDNQLILAGALPAALMALCADFLLGAVEQLLSTGPAVGGKRRRAPLLVASALLVAGVVALLVFGGRSDGRGARVVVGSKDFTEQVILGELLAQAIEQRTDLAVERRFELGGDLCHRGLVAGEIDAYVEYTGTAFATILKHPPQSDARAVYQQTQAEYPSRFHARWLAPLGFNNTFAILVRQADARTHHLRTISDVTPLARGWRAAFGQDFMSRPDGYAGFARAYHLEFAEPPREMDLSLTYRALAGGQVDLIAGNSTDGMIEQLALFQLEDDRHYFPPYEAAPVVREDTLARHPQLGPPLSRLAGQLSDAEMRRLNHAVDGQHRDVKDVVREWLASHP